MKIEHFRGEYEFLSNFYPCQFEMACIDGEKRLFPTSEHAFQAWKATNNKDFFAVRGCNTPGQAKKMGREIRIREDWSRIKDGIMLQVLRAKFSVPEMKEKLLATGDAQLVEGNTWGDDYWGVILTTGKGRNRLGKLLMTVREELRGE